ncbi:MAG: TIGR02594 family protein [Planctomycetota bacterium]
MPARYMPGRWANAFRKLSTADRTSVVHQTKRTGEERVKWCSAFANWCMKQAGITGTRHALALSWLKWGRPLQEPQIGAVVVMKTSKWRHVAFVDEQNGEFVMLGGNQRPAKGKGPDRVSYRPLNCSIILGYRWPS